MGAGDQTIHWSTATLIVGNIAIGVYLGRILLFANTAHHGRWLFMMNQHSPRPGQPGQLILQAADHGPRMQDLIRVGPLQRGAQGGDLRFGRGH